MPENLCGVDFDGIRRKSVVAEYYAQRFCAGEFFDKLLGKAGIKAGHKGVFVHEKDCFTQDGLLADG